MTNQNTLISASAGTGKTFALATHFIRLLLLGENPESIVGLTFSRAAAAEIYNKMISRLAKAAACEDQAAKLSAEIVAIPKDGTPNPNTVSLVDALKDKYEDSISKSVFADILRKVIKSQHLSAIGTIDSFMSEYLSAYSAELGLQGDVEILEDYDLRARKKHALKELLKHPAHAAKLSESIQKMLKDEGAREYTTKILGDGADNKGVLDCWDGVVARIGDRDCVLPFEYQQKYLNATDYDKVVTQCALDIKDKFTQELRDKKTLKAFVGHLSKGANTKKYPDKIQEIKLWETLKAAEQAEIDNLKYSDFQISSLYEAISALEEAQLARTARETHYAYLFICAFEKWFDEQVVNRGGLSFNDVPKLIPRLGEVNRLDIEYRLDGQLKHWALDEFQDTSRSQWNAISNLVYEAKACEVRSVLVVGDKKQAIYGWRGGDVTLFDEIKGCEVESLTKSYRYPQLISDFVNKVFSKEKLKKGVGEKAYSLVVSNDNSESSKTDENRPSVFDDWDKSWTNHVSANKEKQGQLRIKPLNPCAKANFISAIVEELRNAGNPWQHGVSTAVLVHSNRFGREVAEALRTEGVDAVFEGENPVSDTPVVTAITHLITFAEHPEHTLAWEHVKMTPLFDVVQKMYPTENGQKSDSRFFATKVRESLSQQTLSEYISLLVGKIKEKVAEEDEFTRSRLDGLVTCALDFEAYANETVQLSEFAQYVEKNKKRDVASKQVVQVLTIARSKGLTFDYVIVPFYEYYDLFSSSNNTPLLKGEDEKGEPWLMQWPGKAIVESNEKLKVAKMELEAETLLSNVRNAYVALTRTTNALSIYVRDEDDTGRFGDVIKAALKEPADEIEQPALPFTFRDSTVVSGNEEQHTPQTTHKREDINKVRPSDHEDKAISVADFFKDSSEQTKDECGSHESAAERGTRIHEALCGVEWLDSNNLVQPEGVVVADVDLTSVSNFSNALLKPEGLVDLWREKSFELFAADTHEWTTGQLDRVVFYKKDGQTYADIMDYKTNAKWENESNEAFEQRMKDTYTSQMESYKAAVAKLCGIPPENITTKLLLTRTLSAVEVCTCGAKLN